MKHPSRLCSHLLTSLNFLLFAAIPLVTSRKNDSLQPPQIIFSLFLYFSLAAANTCSCSRKTVWVGDIPQAECFNCSCVLSSSTPKTLKMVLLAHSHGLPHSPSDLPLFAASSTTWCSYSHFIRFFSLLGKADSSHLLTERSGVLLHLARVGFHWHLLLAKHWPL